MNFVQKPSPTCSFFRLAYARRLKKSARGASQSLDWWSAWGDLPHFHEAWPFLKTPYWVCLTIPSLNLTWHLKNRDWNMNFVWESFLAWVVLGSWGFILYMILWYIILPKTNIARETTSSQKESSFPTTAKTFSATMLVLGSASLSFICKSHGWRHSQ